jgi:hypothetical protein
MSFPDKETDIPYLTTAEAILEADESPDLFLRSMFPYATPEQIAMFRLYTLGKMHDGITIGLGIGNDPIANFTAYLIGVTDGLSRGEET